jgi:NADPH:quinone reductase-like Zn-dependent oxidoreductase
VLDYTRGDDFTKNRRAHDVVLDAVGKHSFMRSRQALKAGGFYVPTDGLHNLALVPISRLGSRRIPFAVARARKDDLLLLKRLIEDGEYRVVIDRCYRLQDIVDASRYVETQQKTCNVVLTLSGDHNAGEETRASGVHRSQPAA